MMIERRLFTNSAIPNNGKWWVRFKVSATKAPAKAAEECRSPRRFAFSRPSRTAARFWTAAVLCRFQLAAHFPDRHFKAHPEWTTGRQDPCPTTIDATLSVALPAPAGNHNNCLSRSKTPPDSAIHQPRDESTGTFV